MFENRALLSCVISALLVDFLLLFEFFLLTKLGEKAPRIGKVHSGFFTQKLYDRHLSYAIIETIWHRAERQAYNYQK